MRIAVVGLGSIAQRAYLPILAALENVELVLCSRNREQLSQLAARYRVRESTTSITDLSSMRIDAAFVHAATEAHEDIVSFLLQRGMHVYVDKPLAYTLDAAIRLVTLSESTRRFLMVGFNRRYAPMYRSLADQPERRVVLFQKNRRASADIPRRVIFDDFVHVVDTLRFLSPGQVRDMKLDGAGFHFIGSMNRDSGAAEEVLEVMSPDNKWTVRGLVETTHWHAGTECVTRFDDWDSVLHRRGFPQIVRRFLDCVRGEQNGSAEAQDALQTHALCEQIVGALEADGGGSFAVMKEP